VISVVTFKWKAREGYRSHFTSRHVNVMRNMVERHYNKPHRFLCVTDDPVGLDPRIEAVPLWHDYANVPNPTWPDGPSCYRRLKVFSREFGEIAGPRFICIDLDAVIVNDLSPIFDRTEPFVGFRTHLKGIPFCGSLFLMTAGHLDVVWDAFDPETSPALSTGAGHRGSDQGWINYVLDGRFPNWSNRDGVYSYMEIVPRTRMRRRYAAPSSAPSVLPRNARIVFFTGKPDPWDKEATSRSPWINEHYR
jgi:hypothetical protein